MRADDVSITLVEGTCFAISGSNGEMLPGGLDGLYYRDTRMVSRWSVLLDGQPPEPLTNHLDTPYEATFIGRHAQLLVERRRLVGEGMREDIVLRNLGAEDTVTRVIVEVATDFADMFSVRESSPRPLGEIAWSAGDGEVTAQAAASGRQRGIRVRLEGAHAAAAGQLSIDVVVPARGRWQATVQVFPIVDTVEAPPAYPYGEPLQHTEPVKRFRAWRQGVSIGFEDSRLDQVVDRSVQDLGALRVRTPEGAEVVAAGAPWYMTLFGRDSLLTAWMALPVDQELALSTCRALAALQGTRVDPLNEEEPGRILHEVRHGTAFPLSPGSDVYYGTADATPLFCMLVGELHRWGMPRDELAPLLPHVDRALDWIHRYGDRDGDGFVEYRRATDRGLLNQGWKDSSDAIRFGDGRIAKAPIALAEVQAYVYGAYIARSELASAFGDDDAAKTWSDRAAELRERFHESFWLPERGYFAMALDADKRPVDALASNMGHCLWTGIVDPGVADQVANQLMSKELSSGWGIRTLATSMSAYDPMSYHNGSVWPHDSAICAAGLARYGFTGEASQVSRAIFDAAVAFGGRLPELFCGFDRAEFPYPVPYPTSCSPQAWAAAAPFLLVRAMLGLDPMLPQGKIRLAPEVGDFGRIEVRNMPLAGRRVGIIGGELTNLPGIEVAGRI